MAHITQERGACRHRLPYPPFLLFAAILLDATGLGDEPHQGLGLMNVQLINNKEPRGLWIGGNRLGNMRRTIFFRSAGRDGRCHHCPRRHVEVGDQALRPMAEVCICRALDQTWLHRQGRGSPLQRLYPGLLIRTDDMATILGYRWRLLRCCTHGSHLGGTGHGGIRLGVAPVLAPMRLQIRLILQTARHCGC